MVRSHAPPAEPTVESWGRWCVLGLGEICAAQRYPQVLNCAPTKPRPQDRL